jgi:hypothetical protein
MMRRFIKASWFINRRRPFVPQQTKLQGLDAKRNLAQGWSKFGTGQSLEMYHAQVPQSKFNRNYFVGRKSAKSLSLFHCFSRFPGYLIKSDDRIRLRDTDSFGTIKCRSANWWVVGIKNAIESSVEYSKWCNSTIYGQILIVLVAFESHYSWQNGASLG